MNGTRIKNILPAQIVSNIESIQIEMDTSDVQDEDILVGNGIASNEFFESVANAKKRFRKPLYLFYFQMC